MSVVVTSLALDLAAVPGEPTSTTLLLRNEGSVVDELTVEAVGVPAAWVRSEPARVPLLPGQSAEVVVTVTVPREAASTSGPRPFGLAVRSAVDPLEGSVEEGVLTVAAFADTTAELVPRSSRSRGFRRGRHQVAVDNRGNAPLTVVLAAVDLDDHLDLRTRPDELVVPAGAVGFADVHARVRRRMLRGRPVSRAFQVVVRPDGSTEPVVLDGTLVNRAVLPERLGRLLLLLAVGVVLLLAAWQLLLKPAVASVAKDAAAEQTSLVAQQADSAAAAAADNAAAISEVASAAAPPADQAADAAAAEAAATADEQARAAAAAVASPPPVTSSTSLGEPFATRLQADGQSPEPSLEVGEGRVLSITDIFLENPAGDRGTLTIGRGGAVLIRTRLENFRDLDYHFVAPIVVAGGQALQLRVACENPDGRACTPGLLLNGYLRTVPPSP